MYSEYFVNVNEPILGLQSRENEDWKGALSQNWENCDGGQEPIDEGY